MKSLLTKIISVLTIFTLCVGLTACKTTDDKCAGTHTWKLTSTTATCFEGGVESFKCEVCKTTKTENVDAYGHNLIQSSYTAPTCRTNGEEIKKCSRCGFESKTTLLVVDHDYQTKTTNPSTCTVQGNQTLECSMCHDIKYESLPLINHDYRLVNTTPSTCLANGYKYFQCQDCMTSYSEELPFAVHKYETKAVEATCFTHGGTVEKCSICGDEKPINETPLLTHEFGAESYCTHCGIYETLFDENTLNVSWSGTPIGTIRGSLPTKFKNGNAIPNLYWKDHTVIIKITLYDNNNALNYSSFKSSTLESGELIVSHINYVQANKFSLYFGEYDIFSADELKNCVSFKIELSCDGYKAIEKMYKVM